MAEPKRVAIVHDWLVGGGAERVVEQLHALYPEAPIYTSYCSDEWRQRLDGKVVTGWLQHLGKVRKFIPVLRMWWFEHLDLTDYDLVISSSGNGEAFGVKTSKNTLHVNYCHSPTHYYWRHYEQYLASPGFGVFNPLARLGLRLMLGPLRKWDLKASQRPNYYIANSTHIQRDIKTYYHRDSVVIFPPVDVERFVKAEPTGARHGYLVVDRQVPAKRIDLIIAACNQLQLPLTVVGSGPEHAALKQLAGPTITVVDSFVPDNGIPSYMANAAAFIKASFEDFGVVPVEALAAGTPVIAYQAGGALDYVIPGKTGAFFAEQTVESLVEALQSFEPEAYSSTILRSEAKRFSAEQFRQQLSAYIASLPEISAPN